MSFESIGRIVPLQPIEKNQSIVESRSPVGSKSQLPFSSVLGQAIEGLEAARKVSEQDAIELAMGTTSDLHNVMINAAVEQTMIESTVQLTTRAIGAYKEILQMQI